MALPGGNIRLAVRSAVLIIVLAACITSCGTGTPVPAVTATQTWLVDGGQPAVYVPSTGLIVTTASTAEFSDVVALNPTDGLQAWSTPTGGQVPDTVLADGTLVVVGTGNGPQTPDSPSGSPPMIWVLDARSGDEIQSIDLASQAQVISVTGGQVIVSAGNVLAAYSPTTGQRTWQRVVPSSCALDQAAGTTVILGMVVDCPGGTVTLDAVDPSDGRDLWTRVVSHDYNQPIPGQEYIAADPVSLSAEQNTLAISSESIFSSGGQLLQTGTPYAWYALQGTQLVAASQTKSGNLLVTETDMRTGVSGILFSQPDQFGSALLAGNTLYIIAALPGPMLPVVLVEIDTTTGAYDQFALPFPAQNLLSMFAYSSQSALIYTGASVIAELGTGAMAAYRLPQPGSARDASRVEGAAPGKWPAACSLLSSAEITKAAGQGYYAIPRAVAIGPNVPDASTCAYVPEDSRLPVVTVSVEWKSSTLSAAAELMAHSTAGMDRISGIDPKVYCYQYVSCVNGLEYLLRANETIVGINFSAPSSIAETIVREVADNLQREVGNG